MMSVGGEKPEPTTQILDALNKISDDPNNVVFVVSSESKR